MFILLDQGLMAAMSRSSLAGQQRHLHPHLLGDRFTYLFSCFFDKLDSSCLSAWAWPAFVFLEMVAALGEGALKEEINRMVGMAGVDGRRHQPGPIMVLWSPGYKGMF